VLMLIERQCVGHKYPTCLKVAYEGYLCAECRAENYENLAHLIDPKYDQKLPHTWEECSLVIARLYGKYWERDLGKPRPGGHFRR